MCLFEILLILLPEKTLVKIIKRSYDESMGKSTYYWKGEKERGFMGSVKDGRSLPISRHSYLLLSNYIKLIVIFIVLVISVRMIPSTAHSQAPSAGSASLNSTVSARVGEYYLNLYGYGSPFASIVLTIDGTVYRSAVSDENGNFSITGVLIRAGFDGFCLQAVDFKRLGESVTCFTVPPAKESVEMRDIFLPPTIGLQRSTIEAGGDAVIFGYTMPGAEVTINADNGQSFTVMADETGYYEYTLENLEAGTYSLFATAIYQGNPSEAPSNAVKLTALTWWQQLLIWVRKLLERIVELFTALGLGPLWLVFPLIPLITWLIVRIWPERFTWIYNSKLYAFISGRKKRRQLHHAWFMGY